MEDFTMAFPMYAMMIFNYIRVLLIDALLVAAFILLVQIIKFFKKLNRFSINDVKQIRDVISKNGKDE